MKLYVINLRLFICLKQIEYPETTHEFKREILILNK